MALAPGARLGPYSITNVIGKGGMGEVYQATDTRLDRTVAIKVLPHYVSSDPGLKQRFDREARTISSLNHPHICALYDVGSQDGIDFLVLEYLEGETLAERLAKGPLSFQQALSIATQVADALDKAHRQGIVHRDLKPGNIMLTKGGAKLLDFGLAKLRPVATVGAAMVSAAPTVSSPLTGVGSIVGTFQYMAPEQLEGQEADARTDIFAFGAVLYEMLTGKKAFEGKSQASLIAAVLERDPPSAADVAPPTLDRVLQRCLFKDPEERWQSARDIRHAIAMINDAPASTAIGVTKRWTLAVASLVGFLTALAIGVPLWTTWSRPAADRRPLSFHLTPPAETEFQFSPSAGGSAISPDGQSVAFVAVTNGTPRLWIRPFVSLTARELPDTEGAKFPFWSPDSRSVGFFTSIDLRRIDVSGAEAVILARALNARGGAWNADGTIVFSPSANGPLHQVSASGGTPAPLSTLSASDRSHRWPTFLPDGRTFLYFAQGTQPGVYLTTLDRPGNTRLLFNSASAATYVPGPHNSPGYVLWVARDTVMAQPFDPQSAQLIGSAVAVPGTGRVASSVASQHTSVSVSNDGTLLYSSGGARYQLGWFGRDGTPRGTVGGSEQYIGLRLSPDGHEVLVTIRDAAANGDLWRIDLANGARSRITSEGGGWYAVWSPDSQQVAFTALNQRDVLQVVKARGVGEVETLPRFDLQVFPNDWSFDGKYLAYTAASADTSNDVWRLSMMGARTPTPVLQSPFSERHAQFSPNGRWLAFTSNENGRDDVYVQSFPDPSTRQMVSRAGGAYPRWGPDGRELLYRAPDGRLMTIPLRLVGSSVERGTPAVVMRLVDAPGEHPYPYNVAADGRILALTPASGAVQDLTLTVLMNWQAALER